ncbi:hypothetical protein B0H66DRAFT_218784 [Apodospora peruviana]|uniref:DUF7704 domain-containing protein n=1 Tax=Apodospora peruviana TaxID=516989 RepID=A0AAE0M854_9PEZI|nr:hypothetical protein B0H66DRAFT_218784 [Apodospora peruviana]
MADDKKAPIPGVATTGFALPFVYRLFFLLVEPISALIGAYYAYFDQSFYLKLTHAASAPEPIPLGTTIVMSQLANLYLFFAINECLVLRSTTDLRVWKRVLFCLLVGDLGHLYSVRELGPQIYWSVTKWNAIDWGNIAFVYLGASMRIAFLANVGLGAKSRKVKRAA